MYYFLFAKALAWVFALCALVTLPNLVMMAKAQGVASANGLVVFSRMTLGQMPLAGDVHWSSDLGGAGSLDLILTRDQVGALICVVTL